MGDIAKDIQSTFPSNKVKALINIKYTANWLNNKEVLFFKPFGLSPQQYNVLRILRGAGKPMKAQLVKERMIDRSPNTTRMMDKLLDKKLISRYRCEHDRRVVFIEVTKKGLDLIDEISKSTRLEFLDKITEKEAALLSDLLDKLR
ncbi:MarR family winged helix-turn-helix transcriptional regulator [Pseudofulvibacter geojedonensis]|uniref:HTH-type transcriptional regulator SarZ n=1 Tax=Pseudofulvibacter geojedonensis TaxID=1123758 RepID=A0ABW3I267_9FLAO